MCLDVKVFFLTFVLVGSMLIAAVPSKAAPSADIPPSGIILNDTKEYFFPSKWVTDTTDFGVGIAEGVFDKSKERDSLTLFSLGRSHYQENKTAYDYKVLLASKTFVGFEAGYRWAFPEILPEEPYVKIGAAILLDPKDQIANFIDYQRYYLQFALGCDNFFQRKRAFKIEFGARFGEAGTHAFASIAYGLAD